MSNLFSIITPVYNSEKYICTCIDSIINQSYENFELILIDDGSKDESGSICDKYALKDSRIKVIHQENGGQTVARQTGANAAIGDFVVCIDSDDWIDKNYLKQFNEAIEKYNVDVVCCGTKRVIDNKVIDYQLNQRSGLYTKDQIEKEIYPIMIQPAVGEAFSVCLWGKAIRSNLFKRFQNKVDRTLKMGEDLSCFLPCLYHSNSLYVLKNCLYYYRDNPTSFTKKKNIYDWNGPKHIMNCLVKSIDLKKSDLQQQFYRRGLRELFLVVVSQFNRDEEYGIIKKDILFHINSRFYKKIIYGANFKFRLNQSNVRYCMYLLLLKFKLLRFIKLYNKYLYR